MQRGVCGKEMGVARMISDVFVWSVGGHATLESQAGFGIV